MYPSERRCTDRSDTSAYLQKFVYIRNRSLRSRLRIGIPVYSRLLSHDHRRLRIPSDAATVRVAQIKHQFIQFLK